MLNRIFVLVACLVLGLALAGSTTWTLISTPATGTFNGISAPNSDFAIAVGENGEIVHFLNGDSGTLMPSGTTEELYDVYASSANLAVAAGKNVVLLWDGSSWSTARTETNDTIFTGTWITPEEDAIYYGVLGGQFSFVCPIIPADPNPLFCRTFGPPMLTACGNSDDIKLFTAAGDIFHVDNYLGDLNGFGPIHEEPIALSLDGAWIPQGSCIPGSIAPLEAFAIRNQTAAELWHFDGSNWDNMNVIIPADQTFTWIGGIGPNDVFAVGFKPDGLGGNEGVVWHYDGNSWTEDLTLPADTPGLTDVAVNIAVPDIIFMDGFEGNIIRMSNGYTYRVDILATAEYFAGSGVVLTGDRSLNLNYTDVLVEKTRLTSGPFSQGDSITYQLVLQNISTVTATNFRFKDGFADTMVYASDTCGFTLSSQGEWTYYDTQVASLVPYQVITCTMTLTINGQLGDKIDNYAMAIVDNDYNPNNNISSNSFFIEALE